MGATPSQYDDLSKNVCLDQFCSSQNISPNDTFWNRFLSFNIRPPITRNDQIELGSKLDSNCQHLLMNNLSTGNFGSLIEVTISKAKELLASIQTQDIMAAWQTYNALFAVRCILKYLIETVGEQAMLKHVDATPSHLIEDQESLMRIERFITSLVQIIIDVPLCEFTYVVHLEAINCLLVLLSVQLFSQASAEYSPIYGIIMNDEQVKIYASILICTLLHNFVQQQHAPPGLLTKEATGSLVFSIAAGLWNVITRGMGSSFKNIQITSNGSSSEEEKKRDIETPLASQSLLLLLVLTNHCTTLQNPYREALFNFTSIHENHPMKTEESIIPFRFNLDKLFHTICKLSNADEVILLLYMFLHRNPHIKEYIISRSDIQLLVIPILQILYHAPDNTSHHIYMSLIILLILSEDESFNKKIHQIILKGITWYTERCISEISLGGLLILIVIRTIQYNMLKMRDKYLHTNCLAALANMSAQFDRLHPYVSQRLVSLFETLSKKHARLEMNIRTQHYVNMSQEITPTDNGDLSKTDLLQDLTILQEVLRMILEIINSCLTHRLAHNPNLIYALLYKKDIFQPYRTHSAFQDIIQNIYSVIGFFSYKLEQTDQSQIGVSKVLAIIQQGTTQWPKDRLRKFPELKFRYVEEEQPEEFFIPYIWSIVCQTALLYWNAENIKVFLPNNDDRSTIIMC